MIPFYIIFLVLAIFAFLDGFEIKKGQKGWVLFGVIILLVAFSTFRQNIGYQDYDEYVISYEDVVNNGLWSDDYSSSAAIFEPGFVLTYYISSCFSSEPVFGLFVIAVMAVGLNLWCYKKYTKFFFVAVLLYFVHTFALREMMQIRAGMAAAICLYSLRYVESKQVWRFIVIILVAMSFHLASAIFLSVYWIYKANWSSRTWSYLVGISLFIGLFFPMGKLLSNIPVAGIGARIGAYVWMIGGGTGVFTNPTIVKQLFFVILGLSIWNRMVQQVPHFRVLFICLIMSVCWLMLWNDFPIVAGRLGTFFSVVEVLVIPSFLYLFTEKSRPIVIGFIVVYALLTLWLNLYSGNIILYQDYHTLKSL